MNDHSQQQKILTVNNRYCQLLCIGAKALSPGGNSCRNISGFDSGRQPSGPRDLLAPQDLRHRLGN
jgi:hypothetical protein